MPTFLLRIEKQELDRPTLVESLKQIKQNWVDGGRQIGVLDRMKVLDWSTDAFYDWLPWDLGTFGHSNVYIRVVQWRLGGSLFVSTEYSYTHVILKQHGAFNGYSYQHPRMVWDPGVCGLLEDKQSLGGEDL